jgi:hypothetical protein
MPTGTTNVISCRWDQVAVGDVVCDPSWRWQRWVTITKIEHSHGQFHNVWYGDDFSKKPYVANGLNIVNVQIVGS